MFSIFLIFLLKNLERYPHSVYFCLIKVLKNCGVMKLPADMPSCLEGGANGETQYRADSTLCMADQG